VRFDGVRVLHRASISSIARGEALGLVGESGSGKSVTWLAALGLLPARRGSPAAPARGQELVGAPAPCSTRCAAVASP
jgi:peptide/nickel transport system ATP-binding protein